MYCSDSYDEAYGLYASEHPFDANLDFEYDSKSFYDEVDPNLYEPTCGLVGRSSSEAWRAGRVAPPLVVLTSIKMEKETGCSTMKEHAARWEHKMKEKEQQQRREKEKERKIKEKKDAEDEAKWEAIKASLPTESRLGKQKRLAKERNERQLKSKLRWLARKKKKTVAKPLPFGHRRNGGGKAPRQDDQGFREGSRAGKGGHQASSGDQEEGEEVAEEARRGETARGIQDGTTQGSRAGHTGLHRQRPG